MRLGRRVHLAATYDLEKLALFVDGKLMGQRSSAEPPRASSLPFVIGADPASRYYFRGLIDEVRISNVVRYHGDFTPLDRFKSDEKTLLLYEFDEDANNAAHDASPYGHHGVIHGAKWVQFRRTLGKTKDRPAPVLETAPYGETTAKKQQQDWADYLGVPVEKQIDLPGGEKLSLVLIPPGSFLMGSTEADRDRFQKASRANQDNVGADRVRSEGPQRWVRIHEPFYMAKHELTQAQWQALTDNNPSEFKAPGNPVEMVSWNDVAWFLGKLNMAQEGKGLRFVMPTESQWEYACRAGTWSAWHGDNTAATLQEFAWFDSNANHRTHGVGQLKTNAWGLHDMYGNVWEWCRDRFVSDYYEQALPNDSAGPTRGRYRVLRGGGFGDRAAYCRSAHRNHSDPKRTHSGFGFRLAAVLEDVVIVNRPREPDWSDILPSDAPTPAVAPFDDLAAKQHQKAWAEYLGVSVQRELDLPDGEKLTMVLIPPGESVMGLAEAFETTDRTPRFVRITKPFWLSRHEITRGQFRQFVEAKGHKTEAEREDGPMGGAMLNGKIRRDRRFNWRNVGVPQTDEHPVVNVTWNDATAFCDWLSEHGAPYDLPTAAQWEFACRAGRLTAFWHFGGDEAEMSKYEWFRENAGGTPRPVGQLQPNAFGLNDMHGNVREWCADYFGWDYLQTSTNDPVGMSYDREQRDRVFRGGCIYDHAMGCRSSVEFRKEPFFPLYGLGFRVAQPIEILMVEQAAATQPIPKVVQPSIPLEHLQEAGVGELQNAAPTKLDEFEKEFRSKKRGNAAGRFFIESKGGYQAWNKASLANGIVEVTGRVASDHAAWWFLHLQQHWPAIPPNENRGVRIAVSSSGRVMFGDSFFPPGHESFFPDRTLTELGPKAASEFHTIAIILRDRSIWVFCDGKLISDEVKLDFDLAPGVVALGVQGKGRVEFERIATWQANEGTTDWKPLFDGKTLDGWRIEGGRDWYVEQGDIVARAKRSRLVTLSDDFGEFEVRLECKLARGANSGLHARTVFDGGWESGYEAQLSNEPSQRTLTGGIYGHTVVKDQLAPDDQWFKVRFRVVGTELSVFINGEMTSQTKVEDGPSKGSIGLQSWNESETRFRNIEVRRLLTKI